MLPLLGREIPIVADEYVDPAFGTGAVKVTPAHDPNDFEIGERHGCAKINILDADATHDRGGRARTRGSTATRRASASSRTSRPQGLLVKIEDHMHSVGHCYRCHTVIEPWLSDQWFVDMKPLAAPAIEAVRDGRVALPPRALGERLLRLDGEHPRLVHLAPAVVGPPDPGLLLRRLRRDDGVAWSDLDDVPEVRRRRSARTRTCSTRGSPRRSGRSPRSAGRTRRPSSATSTRPSVLSTARDILFLWVARMIMQRPVVRGRHPVPDVIIHPTVFNAEGKRMSKSLGTGVDPLDLMEHYGADGMRFGLMLQATGNQDIKFAEEKLLSLAQLREQDLEREPVRADEPRRLRARAARGRDRGRRVDPLAARGAGRGAWTRAWTRYEFGDVVARAVRLLLERVLRLVHRAGEGAPGRRRRGAARRRSATSCSCSTRRCGCCTR